MSPLRSPKNRWGRSPITSMPAATRHSARSEALGDNVAQRAPPEAGLMAATGRHGRRGLDGVNFFVAAVQTGFGAFVAVYLTENRWTPAQVGFALTIATMCGLLSQIPAGAFVDRLRDKRHAVRTGALGVGVGAVLLALTPSEPAVYLAEALQGIGSSLIGPGIAATSLAVVGQKGFSERIGRNARYASIGNGLTAGVMGAAGSYLAPVSVFWLTAALTVPLLISLSLVRQQPVQNPAAPVA